MFARAPPPDTLSIIWVVALSWPQWAAPAASSKAASNRLLPGGFECQDFLHGERAELLDPARMRAAQKVK